MLYEVITYGFDPNTTEELRTREGLPNFFKKLKAGEEVKVGYFGGSITNGGEWREKSLEWLKKEYPKAKISHVITSYSIHYTKLYEKQKLITLFKEGGTLTIEEGSWTINMTNTEATLKKDVTIS